MRRRRQKGSTLVETGLVLTLFVVVMLGVVDFGHFLYLHQALAERVRVSARAGVIYHYTAEQVKNRVVYGTANPAPGAPAYMGLSLSNVNAEILDQSTNDKRLVVTLSGRPFKMISPWLNRAATSMPIRVATPLETP